MLRCVAALRSQLRANFSLVSGGKLRRVLVPLCGKTVDMMWLVQQGHTVVGVEGVKQAIVEFMQEHDLTFTVEKLPGDVDVFSALDGKLRIVRGDLFSPALSAEVVGPVDCAWDRGSLVAVDPSQREAYAAKLISLLQPGATALVEVVRYDQSEMDGPPFSVTDAHMRHLYSRRFAEVTRIHKWSSLDARFQEKGVTAMHGVLYVLKTLRPSA